VHDALERLARARRWSLIDQRIKHFLNAKIINRRTKKYGGLFARQKGCRVKNRCCCLNEFRLALMVGGGLLECCRTK
jgi:hypothetical protein